MSISKQNNLKIAKKWLRKNFTSLYPVRVVLVDKIMYKRKPWPDDVYGLTSFNEKCECFLIQILNNLNLEETIDTLRHEWAHVLSQHTECVEGVYQEHDDIYWGYYGKIYRKWYEED
jgi:hypothetical protein